MTARYIAGFEPIFQFTLNDKKSFKYSVISIESKWDSTKLNEGSVGIVDEVGRKNIKPYMEEIMAGKKFKRIKQVGKVADLFPLLSLGNVNYIIIAPHDLDILKREFATKTYKIVDTIDINYPVLSIKTSYDVKKAEKFEKISKIALKTLGFDGIIKLAK